MTHPTSTSTESDAAFQAAFDAKFDADPSAVARRLVAAYQSAPWPVSPDLHAMLIETDATYIAVDPDDPRPILEQPRHGTILEAIAAAYVLTMRHQRPIDMWAWDAKHQRFHNAYPYPFGPLSVRHPRDGEAGQ